MDRGIYAAASSGLHQTRRLDVVADNLANTSTVGFKAQRLQTRQQEFADTLSGQLKHADTSASGDHDRSPGVIDMQSVTDFTPGPVAYTGDPLNVALAQKDLFFVVNTPEGPQYTRAGNFMKDSEGNLVTPDGYKVNGDGGPISLPVGSARITSTGTVIVDGENVGRLQVVQIEDTSKLQRAGSTRFSLEGAAATAVPADVIPESVEMPNVSVIDAMVDMIAANRGFEAYSKTVRTIDEINDVALRQSRGA